MVPVQEEMIRDCAKAVAGITGDVVEIGVHTGGSADVICEAFPESMAYLFDTFCGMPASKITPQLDYHRATDFADTSEQAVVKKLDKHRNYRLIAGVFPESATVSPRIKFAHIDVDLYQSTKDALEWCWERLVEGGVILNDDYQCSTCAGAKKAVDEFIETHDVLCEIKHHRAVIWRHL